MPTERTLFFSCRSSFSFSFSFLFLFLHADVFAYVSNVPFLISFLDLFSYLYFLHIVVFILLSIFPNVGCMHIYVLYGLHFFICTCCFQVAVVK